VLETQKQGLIEAQRRASEALRLADDRLARAKGETELKKERANRELAALRLQLSEAELTNVGIVLQGAQAEIQALELSTAETQRLVTRVLASQTLPREDVDKQQTRLRDALSKLAGEIDRRAAINTRQLGPPFHRTRQRRCSSAGIRHRRTGPDQGRPGDQASPPARA